MLSEVYRICSKCATANEVTANFCLKCGTKLTAADEKPLLKHGGQFSDALDNLSLTEEEHQAAGKLIILAGPIPQGYAFSDMVYANVVSDADQSDQLMMTKLVQNLYRSLYSLQLSGVANLKIVPMVSSSGLSSTRHHLLAYGDGFKPIAQS